MGQIAKFFSGGKSGTKALLEAYAKFGKEAVNNYFKNRKLTEKFNFDELKNKKDGGMVSKSPKSSTKRRAGAAKRGFNNFKGIF